MTTSAPPKAVYRVIDAYDHPHGGRILRVRLGQGEALKSRELKGGTLVASSPDGREVRLKVDGFALFGGRPTDSRLARTGRVDIHIRTAAASQVRTGWVVAGPA